MKISNPTPYCVFPAFYTFSLYIPLLQSSDIFLIGSVALNQSDRDDSQTSHGRKPWPFNPGLATNGYLVEGRMSCIVYWKHWCFQLLINRGPLTALCSTALTRTPILHFTRATIKHSAGGYKETDPILLTQNNVSRKRWWSPGFQKFVKCPLHGCLSCSKIIQNKAACENRYLLKRSGIGVGQGILNHLLPFFESWGTEFFEYRATFSVQLPETVILSW